MTQQQFFASCPRGLETLLADELRELGAATVELPSVEPLRCLHDCDAVLAPFTVRS